MQTTRPLLTLATSLVMLSGCAQLTEQAAGPDIATATTDDRGGFDHCTPDGSTCYQTAEDLARWGGHDHDETQPEPLPTPEPQPLPESSTDLVI